jgi:hypothetical protein
MADNPSPPPTLRQVQQWMAARILSPDPPDLESAQQLVCTPPRGDVGVRLGVYVGGYPARVQESLRETFPAVAHLAGVRRFSELSGRYVAALALHSYNLNDVGMELAKFLRSDVLGTDLPFLADLAELEWRVACAFHAHERAPLDPTPLGAWSDEQWEHAVLGFQPSVALVCSAWPIRELWASRETAVADIDIDLRDRSDRVLVRRCAMDVHCESLADGEARALEALLSGQPLGEVTAMLASHGDDGSQVSGWFAGWMQHGLIIDCRL